MTISEEERAVHEAMVVVFQEKVEDARNLEKCMDKLLIDYGDVLEKCDELQLKHFCLDLIRKVYYIIGRVKLLKTGQCNIHYQIITEHEYVSLDHFGSFEKNVDTNARDYLPGLKLSCCSYEGIRFFASDKKSNQKLMLDNARNDLDLMIMKYLTGLENTLHVLFNRDDIHKKETLVEFKKNQRFKIVNTSRSVLVDSMVLASERINIFLSNACQRDDILALRITPLEGCEHSAWLTTRGTMEQEVASHAKKRHENYIVQQKELDEKNKALNIGSRVPGRKRRVDEISSNFDSTPMNKAARSFVQDCSMLSTSGFQTTCDSGDSSSSSSSSSSGSSSSKGQQLWTSNSPDRFMDNGSTPTFTADSNPTTVRRAPSEVANLDLSVYDYEETPNEKRIRQLRQTKKDLLAEEDETAAAEFGDFYVKDGAFEEEEPGDDVVSLRLPTASSRKTSSSSSFGPGQGDEEYNEEEDFDLQKYAVVKKTERDAAELKAQNKLSTKSAVKDSKAIVKAERLAESIKSENPFGCPEKKYVPIPLRKKTKGDYAVSYVEDIEVLVHNKLYSMVVDVSGPSRHAVLITRTPEEVQAANRELDSAFITFLVQHTVTVVGSEIALERCIVDYVLKKQNINGLGPLEQQEISNWRDIFIKIENIICNQVRDESIAKKDSLDLALGNTINLEEQRFRTLRNEVVANESISGREQTDALVKLRGDADAKNARAKALTMELKALLDVTLKTTNQKINSTIHYIAMKVCLYWANINNCVDIIPPELVDKYTARFMKHDQLKIQLAAAESNGILLLNAPQCEDQPNVVEDMNGTLVAEESQLRSIMQKDHANELVSVIYSVKAKVEDIVTLVDILWTKSPRTKLSNAVAVKDENKQNKSKATAAAVEEKASVVVANVSGSESSPSAVLGAALAGGDGWTQTTLANTGGKLGLSLTGEKSATHTERLSSPTSTELPVYTAPTADGPRVDLMARFKDTLRSYDAVVKGLLTGLTVRNDSLCLDVDFKNKRQFMGIRFQFLHFLLVNKDRNLDEVVKMFSENEQIYDLLNCFFYVKMDGVDGLVILGDGYCFYRAVFQLYLNHVSDYTRTAKEMKTSDRKCNVKKELTSPEHSAFVSFVEELKTLVKEDSKLAESTAKELALFKFQMDCDLLPVLLKKRAGLALDSVHWGCQSVVSLLNFNVTCLEVLAEKPSSAVEILLSADPMCSKKSTRWTRYHSSSMPVLRTQISKAKSAVSFQDLDVVASVPMNALVYTPGHFTAGAAVYSVSGPSVSVHDELFDLKKRFFAEAFKRVQIMEDLCPDAVERISVYHAFAKSPTSDRSLIVPNLEQFDSNLFLERLHVEFPESVRIKGDLVDLTGEEDSTDTAEVAELKEKVKLEKSKVEIVAQHNELLRKLLNSD